MWVGREQLNTDLRAYKSMGMDCKHEEWEVKEGGVRGTVGEGGA